MIRRGKNLEVLAERRMLPRFKTLPQWLLHHSKAFSIR